MSIRKAICQLVLCAVLVAGLCDSSSATIVIQDDEGNVTIYGTENDDVIHVNQAAYPLRHVYISFVNVIGWHDVVRVNELASISFHTYAGDDLIVFRTSLGGDLYIDSGSGDDLIIMYPAYGGQHESIGGDATIETGDGNDTVNIECDMALGVLSIETGEGDDTVSIANSMIDECIVRTNNGSDEVEISNSFFWYGIEIRLGPDRDEILIEDSFFYYNCPVIVRGGASNEDLGTLTNCVLRSSLYVRGVEQGNIDPFRNPRR